MPAGFLFWLVWLLCLISVLTATFGWGGAYALPVSGVVILVLTGLLGYKVFGPPVQ